MPWLCVCISCLDSFSLTDLYIHSFNQEEKFLVMYFIIFLDTLSGTLNCVCLLDIVPEVTETQYLSCSLLYVNAFI